MASDAPRFIVRPAAEADVEEAALWYERRALGVGAEFLRAVDVCFDRIRRNPESFQQIYKDARRARIRRFPYVAYLPGAFFLLVDVGAAKATSTEHANIRKSLADWILATGASLEPEEQSGPDGKCDTTEKPAGVPFEVTLHRDADYDSRLFIIQNLSGNRESLQRDRIRTALARKCAKLLQASKGGLVSMLVLESDDIALANRRAIANATVAELSTRDDAPDIVIWARPSTNPWKAWFLKDGDETHPDVSSAGPYVLDLSAVQPGRSVTELTGNMGDTC